jgi:hypothetical protein
MQRISQDLAGGERDDRGTPEQRRKLLDVIDADRSARGRELLDDRAPEEGINDRRAVDHVLAVENVIVQRDAKPLVG